MIEKSRQSLEFPVKFRNLKYLVVIYTLNLSIAISEIDQIFYLWFKILNIDKNSKLDEDFLSANTVDVDLH